MGEQALLCNFNAMPATALIATFSLFCVAFVGDLDRQAAVTCHVCRDLVGSSCKATSLVLLLVRFLLFIYDRWIGTVPPLWRSTW
jgi:hypothetical protein